MELLDKMNQQFTDMQKLANDFHAMAEQALRERDKARDALRKCRLRVNDYLDKKCSIGRLEALLIEIDNALEGK